MAAEPPRQTLRPPTLAADLGRLAGRASARAAAWEQSLPRITLGAAVEPGAGATESADLQIRGTLGEGGMGRVLLAWQRSLGREVAVKTLKDAAAPEEARFTLLREGLIAGSLEHPGIVPVHALGVGRGGEPLLVQKRIDGTSWQDLLRDERHPMLRLLPGGREDPLQAHLFILTQVCNAAHFAHSRGVLHRDIKPDNVMVGAFGEVYLLDWGIAARLPEEGELRTAPEALVGTPLYMAPEMVSAEAGALGARTDVYLLGATLHEVLTGAPRHGGRTVAEVLRAALQSPPPSYEGSVPAELAALCRASTARDPAARPESALAFRQAIEVYLQHRGSERIADDARGRLAELRRILPDPAQRGAAQRLAIECRFAFHMALRAWPESESAQAGLLDCVTLLCEDALGQRRPAEARALLAELEDPPEALRQRVAALEAELSEEHTRSESLRRLARDQDERVGAGARAMMTGIIIALDLLIRGFVVGFRGEPTLDQALWTVAIVLALFCAGIFLGRRALLANAFSRRLTAAVVVMGGLHLLDRIVAKALGTPVQQVLRTDLLTSAAMMLGVGITLHRSLLWLAVLPLGALGLSTLLPQAIGAIFQTTLLLMLAGGVLLHYRIVRASAPTLR